ncbi:hypothetical protein [Nocardia otitidiscaviarum]|uniref:hypothetical protein n=1 Tax=Nocardia otitidiscaviarum TaxID=1823 RepID=UPI0004A70F41|nr:hypothetical protein [Nocardia otitidiscaviarum]
MSAGLIALVSALVVWTLLNTAMTFAVCRGVVALAELCIELGAQHLEDPAAHALPPGTVSAAEAGVAPAADTDTTGGAS